MLNLTFVIFSAILAEIIVSIIAIILTTSEIEKIQVIKFKFSLKLLKLIPLNGFSNNENVKLGY